MLFVKVTEKTSKSSRSILYQMPTASFGASLDILKNAAVTIDIETKAVTDNSLVLVEENKIVSGITYAEPIGFAADQIVLALAEIGSIRMINLMVDPTLSHDLPPFLTDDAGLNSGSGLSVFAALMSENKHLANPCVTDPTPTSANQKTMFWRLLMVHIDGLK